MYAKRYYFILDQRITRVREENSSSSTESKSSEGILQMERRTVESESESRRGAIRFVSYFELNFFRLMKLHSTRNLFSLQFPYSFV